ncbi:MAG TPA: alpha-hydroxy-acid oxidizing protein, partial [Streptosporangiaceae bacterium]
PTFFGAYAQWAATPPPAWEDVAWLRQLWGGPFLVKGITRVDDAKRAVDAGATAVSVSNHGGPLGGDGPVFDPALDEQAVTG